MGKPNKGGNLVIKHDMDKAYDKVSWLYFCAVLRRLGFDENWVDLIYRFISNNWYSLVKMMVDMVFLNLLMVSDRETPYPHHFLFLV